MTRKSETAPLDEQPGDAIQSSAADQNAQRQDFPHDAASEASDDSAGSEDTVCDNKQPDAAVPDTADTDKEPLTSETGQPVSDGDTDTEPRTSETGQPVSDGDTDREPLTSETGQPVSDGDTDTEPLTSETGQPVSDGDTDTEPRIPETGQPIRKRDTDTTTWLSFTHVL